MWLLGAVIMFEKATESSLNQSLNSVLHKYSLSVILSYFSIYVVVIVSRYMQPFCSAITNYANSFSTPSDELNRFWKLFLLL